MSILNGLRIKYTSPSCIPYPYIINTTWIYRVETRNDIIYITDGNLMQKIDYEFLKQLFTPIDYSWKEVDNMK